MSDEFGSHGPGSSHEAQQAAASHPAIAHAWGALVGPVHNVTNNIDVPAFGHVLIDAARGDWLDVLKSAHSYVKSSSDADMLVFIANALEHMRANPAAHPSGGNP